jgi:hypothetical protein
MSVDRLSVRPDGQGASLFTVKNVLSEVKLILDSIQSYLREQH